MWRLRLLHLPGTDPGLRNGGRRRWIRTLIVFFVLFVLALVLPGFIEWALIVMFLFGLCLILLMYSLGRAIRAEIEIIKAAKAGDEAAVSLFLAGQPRTIKASDKDGNTLLHWAVKNGHLALIELLLFVGADQEAKNRLGQRPIDLAVKPAARNLLLNWEKTIDRSKLRSP
ncbi:MAG: ankyrin repeat domain-containing protein [Proteobacteria bacterium]|nr:ankyrin repeat domain-containing protein [Pseudomonadota bacterium]